MGPSEPYLLSLFLQHHLFLRGCLGVGLSKKFVIMCGNIRDWFIEGINDQDKADTNESLSTDDFTVRSCCGYARARMHFVFQICCKQDHYKSIGRIRPWSPT
jgi:hypothetical protein